MNFPCGIFRRWAIMGLLVTALASGASSWAETNAPLTTDTNIYDSVTVGGETFRNVRIVRIEPDAITISHSTGGYRVPYETLPKDWQERYGFDPEKAAIYRANLEEEAQKVAEAKQKATEKPQPAPVDEDSVGAMWIRVDSVAKSDREGFVIKASQRFEEAYVEMRTNSTVGISGPSDYSHKTTDTEAYRYKQASTSKSVAANPSTKLNKTKPDSPGVSKIASVRKVWHALQSPILIVEATDLKKDWEGNVFPCGVSGEHYPRFALSAGVALAWKDRKPGMSVASLEDGFLDAILSPARAFHFGGTGFVQPLLRNLTYWVGIALGAIAYLIIFYALRRR